MPVVPIESYTGFPEMMDGRVKTLHPRVHGGLLCRRDNPGHVADAENNGIGMIDLVCVNLYEFEKTVADPSVTLENAIEHIDIGGPSMLRSAAKNNDFVTVVVDPADYGRVLDEMRVHDGATTRASRQQLALKVFKTTAAYDGAIATYLSGVVEAEQSKFPETLLVKAIKEQIFVTERILSSPQRFIRCLELLHTLWQTLSNFRVSPCLTTICLILMQLGLLCVSLMVHQSLF